ncbi:MAG: S6e family ribosomal protein [Candidatus Pacearchaeota archaeon]
MLFKINISEKGKTYRFESESESLIGMKIGDVFSGSEILRELQGYELQIRGTSDKSGFPGHPKEKGPNLRKVMFSKGKFLRKTPHKGFRRKKTVRGNEISSATIQVNMVVIKSGNKRLDEIFHKEDKKEKEA